MPDLLRRRKKGFVLWRPSRAADVPVLVIGTLRDRRDGEAELADERRFEMRETLPGLWELPAEECGLVGGKVYHYWFEVDDTNVYKPAAGRRRILVTDPAATAVDWRLLAPRLPPPYGDEDRDPAAVVLFRDGRLVPCDPGGETVDWSDDGPLAELPANDRLVIYELPTSWAASGSDGGLTVGVGTFRDAMSLLSPGMAAAGFPGVPALAAGRSHLAELASTRSSCCRRPTASATARAPTTCGATPPATISAPTSTSGVPVARARRARPPISRPSSRSATAAACASSTTR
jgi:hypothetical protein